MRSGTSRLSLLGVLVPFLGACVSLPVPDPEIRTLNERNGLYEADIRYYSNDRKSIPKVTEAAKDFCRSQERLYEYKELAFDPNRCSLACGVTTLVFFCR
jgi:hypothetical protein